MTTSTTPFADWPPAALSTPESATAHGMPQGGQAPAAPVLFGRAVTKHFGDTVALNNVDIALAPGESVAIMGPSGSGKSTLLHCMAGVLKPDAGAVLFAGRDLAQAPDRERTRLRREHFGFVFQFGQLLSELPADENVALPLMLLGSSRREACRAARAWLASLGLAGKEGRRPGEMSGGEAQRVAVARALCARPAVVFADEPTGSLDTATGAGVMTALIDATRSAGAALVVVTHDPVVASWCSRTVEMRDGRVVTP